MEKAYTEKIPAIEIKHIIIICDNPHCATVIRDEREFVCCPLCDKPLDVELTKHLQTGNEKGDKLLDFCSETCSRKTTKQSDRGHLET